MLGTGTRISVIACQGSVESHRRGIIGLGVCICSSLL